MLGVGGCEVQGPFLLGTSHTLKTEGGSDHSYVEASQRYPKPQKGAVPKSKVQAGEPSPDSL